MEERDPRARRPDPVVEPDLLARQPAPVVEPRGPETDRPTDPETDPETSPETSPEIGRGIAPEIAPAMAVVTTTNIIRTSITMVGMTLVETGIGIVRSTI